MPRMTPEQQLTALQQLARDRGGELLSPVYQGDATKLRWRCAGGHLFEQAPTSTKQGRWCRICGVARAAKRKHAPVRERLLQVLAERGGRLLTETSTSSHHPIRFQCAQGHEWETSARSVLAGNWCLECSSVRRNEAARTRLLARLKSIAAGHGGEVLDSKAGGWGSRVELRCARGHTWRTFPLGVVNGAWCSKCQHQGELDRLHELAMERGGILLSKDFVNENSRVLLQ